MPYFQNIFIGGPDTSVVKHYGAMLICLKRFSTNKSLNRNKRLILYTYIQKKSDKRSKPVEVVTGVRSQESNCFKRNGCGFLIAMLTVFKREN